MNNLKEQLLKVKIHYFLAFGAVLGFLYYFNFFNDGSSIDAEISNLDSEITIKQKVLQRVQGAIKDREKFEKEISLISLGLKEFLEYFPADVDRSSVQEQINSAVRFAGANLVSMKPIVLQREYTNYREIGYEVDAEGEFHQLMSFLARVTQIKYVVNFKDMTFDTLEETGDFPKLKMKSTFIVYSYSQESEASK